MIVQNLVSFTPEEQETLVAAGKILGGVRDFAKTQENGTVFEEYSDKLIMALYNVVYELIPHKAN